MIDLRDDDTLLSEALADHADGRTDREGCYALAIDAPDSREAAAHAWLDAYQTPPPYLDALADAREVVYVGRSSNVRDRIAEHLASDVRTASLPSVFGVIGIVGIRWGENSDHAERVYADDLRAELGPDVFVHSR